MAHEQKVTYDRWENPVVVVGCKPNKKNADFCTGYIELGGQLYKLEPSRANKDGVAAWIRVTKLKKRDKAKM